MVPVYKAFICGRKSQSDPRLGRFVDVNLSNRAQSGKFFYAEISNKGKSSRDNVIKSCPYVSNFAL